MTEASVTVTLPDGSQKQTAAGTPIGDFVRDAIGPGLAKAAVLAKANGAFVDLSRTLDQDTHLEIFTTKSPEALDTIRHDAAHIVADAVQRLFPGTQVTIGPSIEHGFYYDFDRGQPFTEEELARIEVEANKIVAADLRFERREVTPDEAIARFTAMGEAFKVEIIQDIVARGATVLTLYGHGDWVDFCEGPHGPSTGRVGVIKLLSSSAAYWRGDHRNKSLQRIYGTAFFDKKGLDAWLKQREEAEKRDHRRLGRELDLFHFHAVSPGAAFWTPKGTAIYTVLSAYMRQLALGNGYVEIKTPLLYHKTLWEQSGHWGKYKENMFLVEDSEAKAEGDPDPHHISLKPMNCPSHHLYYGFRKQSYRDLPLRLHSQDVLHRNEAAGALGGLTRVRQFAQDDAHIYCREDQISDEVQKFVALLDHVYNAVGLKYTAKFATRPPQRIGDDAMWDRAEASLKTALDGLGLDAELKPGDGAFYGPKIDFDVSDSIGRKWQLGTIQLDYLAPERFDLTYVGEDGKPHRPVVLAPGDLRLVRALHRDPDRALRGRVPGLARAGPGRDRHGDRAGQRPRADHRRPARRGRRAGVVRRRQRDDAGQGPRRLAAEDPVHARHRRQGGRRRRGQRAHLRRRPAEDGDDAVRRLRRARRPRGLLPLSGGR